MTVGVLVNQLFLFTLITSINYVTQPFLETWAISILSTFWVMRGIQIKYYPLKTLMDPIMSEIGPILCKFVLLWPANNGVVSSHTTVNTNQ